METEIKDPEAVLSALERAKNDAKTYRERLEALQEEMNTLNAETEALREEVSNVRGEQKENAIRKALLKEGADPDRVMKFMPKDIEFVDGELQGFDEALKTLKEDLPEIFDAKRRVGGRVEHEVRGDVKAVKSVSEMQADRLMGRAS